MATLLNCCAVLGLLALSLLLATAGVVAGYDLPIGRRTNPILGKQLFAMTAPSETALQWIDEKTGTVGFTGASSMDLRVVSLHNGTSLWNETVPGVDAPSFYVQDDVVVAHAFFNTTAYDLYSGDILWSKSVSNPYVTVSGGLLWYPGDMMLNGPYSLKGLSPKTGDLMKNFNLTELGISPALAWKPFWVTEDIVLFCGTGLNVLTGKVVYDMQNFPKGRAVSGDPCVGQLAGNVLIIGNTDTFPMVYKYNVFAGNGPFSQNVGNASAIVGGAPKGQEELANMLVSDGSSTLVAYSNNGTMVWNHTFSTQVQSIYGGEYAYVLTYPALGVLPNASTNKVYPTVTHLVGTERGTNEAPVCVFAYHWSTFAKALEACYVPLMEPIAPTNIVAKSRYVVGAVPLSVDNVTLMVWELARER